MVEVLVMTIGKVQLSASRKIAGKEVESPLTVIVATAVVMGGWK